MKLRRLIAAGLASVMTVAALAGCGNSSNGEINRRHQTEAAHRLKAPMRATEKWWT